MAKPGWDKGRPRVAGGPSLGVGARSEAWGGWRGEMEILSCGGVRGISIRAVGSVRRVHGRAMCHQQEAESPFFVPHADKRSSCLTREFVSRRPAIRKKLARSGLSQPDRQSF